jgi:hypothetical protein
MKPCACCGWLPDLDIEPGILRDLRAILGPAWRATFGGHRDWICWMCQRGVAKRLGIVL